MATFRNDKMNKWGKIIKNTNDHELPINPLVSEIICPITWDSLRAWLVQELYVKKDSAKKVSLIHPYSAFRLDINQEKG